MCIEKKIPALTIKNRFRFLNLGGMDKIFVLPSIYIASPKDNLFFIGVARIPGYIEINDESLLNM